MYIFKTSEELLKLCRKYKAPISEIAIRYEMEFSEKTRAEVWEKMKKIKKVMREAIQQGITKKQYSALKMSGGNAKKIYKAYQNYKNFLLNPLALRAMAYATATGETNACMGRIAAFPTAGGSGVIPGTLFSYAEEYKISEEELLSGMFCASAIGLLIAENSTLSAAAGGCQSEAGAASAMAAGALTEMRGGTPEQACNASALALKNMLGMACDPLGGLVEVPCIKRNALGALHAFGSSDLSMSGVKSYIPLDEVIEAMRDIGQFMPPRIKETALGGLAVTKTGLKICQKLGLQILKNKT